MLRARRQNPRSYTVQIPHLKRATDDHRRGFWIIYSLDERTFHPFKPQPRYQRQNLDGAFEKGYLAGFAGRPPDCNPYYEQGNPANPRNPKTTFTTAFARAWERGRKYGQNHARALWPAV